MSKLLDNKQLIHIASEIVVLVGLTFHFSKKNKLLLSHIEDVAQRLEEQDDIIQKHEQHIQRLANAIQQLQNNQVTVSQMEEPEHTYVRKQVNQYLRQQVPTEHKVNRKPTKLKKQQHTESPMKAPPQSKPSSTKIQFDSNPTYQQPRSKITTHETEPEIVEDESDAESEEDLDKELADELGDLEEECIDDIEECDE